MSTSRYTTMRQYSWHSMPRRMNYSQLPSLRSRSAPIRTSSDIPGFSKKSAYYSVNPPSAPLYLVSISSLSHEFNAFDQKSKIMINEGKIIAQHVLRLVLNSVVHKAAARTSVATVSVGSSVHDLTQSVAIQTEHIAALNRHEGISSSSSAESCTEREENWIKDLRTLRDSHVRLIMRQLRQLQDLERLGRLFTTKNLPQIVSSSRQDLGTMETSI